MLVSSDYAKAHGLKPLAKIISWASTGTNPRDTGLGPIMSIPKALERAGMTIDDPHDDRLENPCWRRLERES